MTSKRPLAPTAIAKSAFDTLRAHPLRAALTAASMAAAVAAVSLVATVAGTGSAFVLGQIEGVGSNLVYAYYEAGGNVSASEADYIDLSDVEAVRARLGPLAAAVAGVSSTWDSLVIDGVPMQVRVLGSSEEYALVRNLKLHAGRFLQRRDAEARDKLCLVTPELSKILFGGSAAALDRPLKIRGLDFRIVGVFSEGVETFGQSEVSNSSVLVPYTVMRYFQQTERIDPLYVAVQSQERVPEAAALVREVLESRHRPGSLYRVDTLANVLAMAKRILLALKLAMILVACITLAVSGVFIMNMMLIAVSERRFEIGIRRSLGAMRREIRLQFLLEAMIIAGLGGACGLLPGLGLPLVVSLLWPVLPVSLPMGWAALAVLLAIAAGGLFGLLPAARAAKLAPAEALRHE